MPVAMLVVALIVILIGAEGLTNALEHLGERLGISEGVTGSVFAAIGTALPETMVPIVAVFGGGGAERVRQEVGVGAILGAPLMLSTLSLFLMGLFAAHRRGWSDALRPERSGVERDLTWFLAGYGLSLAAAFVPHRAAAARALVSAALVLVYLVYLRATLRASAALVANGHGTQAHAPLFIARLLGRRATAGRALEILLQVGAAAALIVLGARWFVRGVQGLSHALGISALALSLVVVPVATELPEKINSILWIRRRRDTLAFGNITGALVYQGSLLPALGVLLTPWEVRRELVWGMVLTLAASAYLLAMLARGVLRPYHLVFNGVCYAAYLAMLLR